MCKGLVVKANCSYADAPPFDVLIYPGGQGTRPHLRDHAQLDWVRRQRQSVPLLASVCTGFSGLRCSRITGPPTSNDALGVFDKTGGTRSQHRSTTQCPIRRRW